MRMTKNLTNMIMILHECDCPHCRCYSKPKTPYIPKSQRPKDPNSPTPSKDSTTGDGTAGGVDDWLEDIEIQTKSQKNKIAKKKAIPKKKPSKGIISLLHPSFPL
jgi:hypothetical protein